jgi:hypothetical protein
MPEVNSNVPRVAISNSDMKQDDLKEKVKDGKLRADDTTTAEMRDVYESKGNGDKANFIKWEANQLGISEDNVKALLK